jgi:hypothetical protein
MPSHVQSTPPSKAAHWTGYVITALPVILLLLSAVMKFSDSAPVSRGFVHYGIPARIVVPIGIAELVCTVIYLIPCTSVLGAILLSAYLGGATFTNLRVGDSFIGPVIVGVLLWGGLFLRDTRLRALIPFRCRQ